MKNRVNEIISRRQLNEGCILVEKIHGVNKMQCIEYSVYDGIKEVNLGMICNYPDTSCKEGIEITTDYIALYSKYENSIELRSAYDLNENKFYTPNSKEKMTLKDKEKISAIQSILVKKNK